MIAKLSGLLDKLPFNDYKSVLGFILTYGPLVIPAFPFPAAAALISKVGEVVLAVGVLHRALKNMPPPAEVKPPPA